MSRTNPAPMTGPMSGPGASTDPPPRGTVLPPGAVDADALGTAAIARLYGDAPFSYPDLRARGIALSQAASGQLWTDYNLHDPGVTLLESLCYAMTEGVFAADADVADLLTAPDGRIHYRRHALHGAEEALPCRPTTEADWLRYLLDRVPAVRQLRLRMPAADGRWQMALRVADGDGEAAARDTVRAYLAQRNLAEDLDGAPGILRPRWCALEIRLSVEGPRELGDILVELVRRCADIVGAAPPRQPVQARLAQRDAQGRVLPTDELFDGPAVQCGWMATEDLRHDPANRLYFSDLARALREIDGVADISTLRLVPLDAPATDVTHDEAGDSLPWQGPDWALQLRWPEDADALARWEVSRRGSRLHLDTHALLVRLADARQAARVALTAPRTAPYAGQLLRRPTGHYLPDAPYLSSWHHLPPLYREAHLAPKADPARQAQFGAYLALLEQWLAHGSAQTQHLRALFSVARASADSYWWTPLDATHIPGLAGVPADTPAAVQAALGQEDDAPERRSRVLDLMLALHGESCDQHSIQRFGVYYDSAAWQAHLLTCKRRFVQRIVRHTRDRAGGFDYSRPSLGRRGNTAPLQERVGLLLGFAETHSRRLAGVLARHGLALDERPPHVAQPPIAPATRPTPQAGAPDHPELLVMYPPARARLVAHYEEDLAERQVHERLAFHFPQLAPQALPAALFRCAVHAGRYHRVEGASGPELWLGPDEAGHWWPLPVRDGPGGVLAPALYLHELACRVQREAEGLHLVEHILLRPLGQDGGQPDVPETFYAHRISVVLAGWTARGADRSFRDLATETIGLGCPAHVKPDVHWLDTTALAAFEQEFAAWLDARMAHARDSAAVAQLDACAARLRRRLAALAGDQP